VKLKVATALLFIASAAPAAAQQQPPGQIARANEGTVGVITGMEGGTYARTGADLTILDDGTLRVLPTLGKGCLVATTRPFASSILTSNLNPSWATKYVLMVGINLHRPSGLQPCLWDQARGASSWSARSKRPLLEKPGIRLHLPVRLVISTLNKCPFWGITRYAMLIM
jgi:hypothetical protein